MTDTADTTDTRLATIVWAWGREWLARHAAGDLNAAGAIAGYARREDGTYLLQLSFPPRFGAIGVLTVPVSEDFLFTHHLPLLGIPLPTMTQEEESRFLTFFATLVATFYPGMALGADTQKGIMDALGITTDGAAAGNIQPA